MFASVLRLDILALPSGNFLVTEPFGAFFFLKISQLFEVETRLAWLNLPTTSPC